MTLVDYTTSDEDEDENECNSDRDKTSDHHSTKPQGLKRKRESPGANSELPPLPSKFHDLYATKVRVTTLDDPSFHGGRKRITPHIEGNWPSHVYIEWYLSTAEHDLLTSLVSPIKIAAARAGEIEMVSLLTSDLGSPLPLHVSLSRPIIFTGAEKDSFIDSLRTRIIDSEVRPFDLRLANPYWVSNFEKTRWFLALQVRRPDGDELNKLLMVCNGTADEYSQPRLYASPKPVNDQSVINSSPTFQNTFDFSSAYHISIGWTLEQPSSRVMAATHAITSSSVFKSVQGVSIKVETLKVKIGNIITSIPLTKKTVEEKGLFAA